MKDIFKNIEGIEWDNFSGERYKKMNTLNYLVMGKRGEVEFHLADLLANKSWTDACGLMEAHVTIALTKLRNEGEEACLKYIKQTMQN